MLQPSKLSALMLSPVSKSSFLALLFLVAGIGFAPGLVAQSVVTPCNKTEAPFLEHPAETPCEKYGMLACNVEVGAGTTITNSSQLGVSYTGNVCVKGTFWIDNNFTFLNCKIKIAPGTAIIVLPPPNPFTSRIFTLDNSTLFACKGMWKGIFLSNNTTINTLNNTLIEDAQTAIKADNIQYSTLMIENTTFNRNNIGIYLSQSPTLPKAATIAKFNSNKFTCTAPLNGTTDQITYAGIKTENVPFTLNPQIESFGNLFQGLQYGIDAEGGNTTISGRFFRFYEIRKEGIHLNEGSLNIRESIFRNCEEKAININLAHAVNVIAPCNFIVTADIPALAWPNYRTGVYIAGFAVNAQVGLHLGFSADIAETTTPVRGIHLQGGNVGAGTKITITQCGFNIRARHSDGIYMAGEFPAGSETHIFNNSFVTGNPQNTGAAAGVRVEGNKNNLNIYGNRFTGNGYYNYAVHASSSAGVNNYISDNYLEGTGYIVTSGEYFYKGFFINNFQNTIFCSNTDYFGSNYGFDFWGTNTGTDFRQNKMYAMAVPFNIFTNSLVGPQEHTGNEWHPIVASGPFGTIIFRGNPHARCQTPALASSNKFTVHTSQSVWNPSPPHYDFFSAFYPENIEPADPTFDFFGMQSGNPSTACSIQLTGSGGEYKLDRIIVDGQLPAVPGNPSMAWITKSYLYKKLKNNPTLLSSYAPYGTFVSSNATTNIGKFYEVNQKIEEAFKISASLQQQTQQSMTDLGTTIGNLENTDNQIATAPDFNSVTVLIQTKSNYLDQLRNVQSNYDALYSTYKTQMNGKLQDALTLVQQITPTSQLETNEKTVRSIYLQSMLNQSGSFTDAQLADLKSIAQQCPETGGLAVMAALNLLPECLKAGLTICQPAIIDDAVPLSTSSESHSMMASNAHTGEAWLYPNPTASSFFVKLPADNTGVATIVDLTGKIISTVNLYAAESPQEVDLRLSPGVYLVRIQTDKGAVFTEKLFIQSN